MANPRGLGKSYTALKGCLEGLVLMPFEPPVSQIIAQILLFRSLGREVVQVFNFVIFPWLGICVADFSSE